MAVLTMSIASCKSRSLAPSYEIKTAISPEIHVMKIRPKIFMVTTNARSVVYAG